MHKLFLVSSIVLVLVSCANPVSEHNGIRYNEMGRAAERAGDLAQAERYYQFALTKFQTGRSSDAQISMALYNLGRAKGYLCKYDEAEKSLVEALQLQERVTGPESPGVSSRLFELARLSFDRQQFEKAVTYYTRAIPLIRRGSDIESKDPIALADSIDEYAIALLKTGANEKAQVAKQEANSLRTKNAEKKARYVPMRYNQKCV